MADSASPKWTYDMLPKEERINGGQIHKKQMFSTSRIT